MKLHAQDNRKIEYDRGPENEPHQDTHHRLDKKKTMTTQHNWPMVKTKILGL